MFVPEVHKSTLIYSVGPQVAELTQKPTHYSTVDRTNLHPNVNNVLNIMGSYPEALLIEIILHYELIPVQGKSRGTTGLSAIPDRLGLWVVYHYRTSQHRLYMLHILVAHTEKSATKCLLAICTVNALCVYIRVSDMFVSQSLFMHIPFTQNCIFKHTCYKRIYLLVC